MATTRTIDDLPGVEKLEDRPSKHRSTVLYGRSGTGKTTLASSWPKPMLYLDIRDKGTDSIADVKNIDYKEIEDYDDLEDTLLWLKRNPTKYKTVVLDTLSQLQEMMVEEEAKKSKKKASSNKRAGDWGSMTKQAWGNVAGRMKSIIIDFRDLEMEVVFIAQDRAFNIGNDDEADDDAETLAPEIGPRLMPSVTSVLNGAVSSIGNTFIRIKHTKIKNGDGKTTWKEKKEYCLRIGPSAMYVTKLRKPKSNSVPDFIVDPLYEDIIDLIEGAN